MISKENLQENRQGGKLENDFYHSNWCDFI